jgi:O-glycosyl hydrolase
LVAPASDKSNDNAIGGTMANGQAFANALAQYVSTMKAQGINLLAVSVQNEPDANVSYESCSYTGATLASFIGTFMGPALADSGVSIIAPETHNWCDFPNYAPAIFSNAAAACTSIIATHEYGCTPPTFNSAVHQVLSSGNAGETPNPAMIWWAMPGLMTTSVALLDPARSETEDKLE